MKLLLPFLIPFAIGIASGVLAALCGVGGGIVMVPAFVGLLGLSQKVAIATSMAVIVPTAVAATSQHIKNGLVDWRVFAATAIAATLTSFFVADYVKRLSNETLTRVFAVLIILIGVKMLLTPSSKATAPPNAPAQVSPASDGSEDGR